MENYDKSVSCLHFRVIHYVGPKVHLTEDYSNYQRSESTRCKYFVEFEPCAKGLVIQILLVPKMNCESLLIICFPLNKP